MNDFDPYFKWFGIKPEQQPPSLYRLLGVAELESDPDVIEAAAEQRMVFLRNVSSGPRGALAQQMLNEVSYARSLLLDGAKRLEYDESLATSARSSAPSVTQPVAQPAPKHDVPPVNVAHIATAPATIASPIHSLDSAEPVLAVSGRKRRTRKKQPQALFLLAIVVAVGGIGIALALIILLGNWEQAVELPDQASVTTSNQTANSKSNEPITPGRRRTGERSRGSSASGQSQRNKEHVRNRSIEPTAQEPPKNDPGNASQPTAAKVTSATGTRSATPAKQNQSLPNLAAGDILASDQHAGVATTKGMQNTTYRLQAKGPVDIRNTALRCQIWRDNKPSWRTDGVVELSTDGTQWTEVARWDKQLVDTAARANRWHTFSLKQAMYSQPTDEIFVRFRRTQYHSFYIGQVDWIVE